MASVNDIKTFSGCHAYNYVLRELKSDIIMYGDVARLVCSDSYFEQMSVKSLFNLTFECCYIKLSGLYLGKPTETFILAVEKLVQEALPAKDKNEIAEFLADLPQYDFSDWLGYAISIFLNCISDRMDLIRLVVNDTQNMVVIYTYVVQQKTNLHNLLKFEANSPYLRENLRSMDSAQEKNKLDYLSANDICEKQKVLACITDESFLRKVTANTSNDSIIHKQAEYQLRHGVRK